MEDNRFLRMVIITALLASVILGVGGVLAAGQAAPNVGLLRFNPSPATGVTGGTVDVSIVSESVTNIYGVELDVSFDPSVITVVDADAGKGGVQITPGTCPAPDFVASNAADNAAGIISYAATQLNPSLPCAAGEVAAVTFRCTEGLLEKTTTQLTFATTIISDPDGSPIAHDPVNGTVECEANIFFIEGDVALQAWPDPAGVVVVLQDNTGAVADGPVVIGSDGAFELQGLAGSVYTVTASYDRYLGSEAAGVTSSIVGERINLGTTTLRAGDINGDGKINILDISGVAGNFSKQSPTAWTP